MLVASTEEEFYLHSLLLITISRKHATTSEQARHYVYTQLQTKPLFMNEEPGYTFVCEWYVIGGRFSGLLTKFQNPTTLSRVLRNVLRNLGYTDDAMLIDYELYLRL